MKHSTASPHRALQVAVAGKTSVEINTPGVGGAMSRRMRR